jgi:hypothetical protein
MHQFQNVKLLSTPSAQATLSTRLRRLYYGHGLPATTPASQPKRGANMAGQFQYSVVWPRSPKSVDVKPLAPRLSSLEGRTVAFVWDFLFRGDEIWPTLKEALTERFPGMHFVDHDAFGSTHGEDELRILAELPQKLRSLGVDAVVSGMGC